MMNKMPMQSRAYEYNYQRMDGVDAEQGEDEEGEVDSEWESTGEDELDKIAAVHNKGSVSPINAFSPVITVL